MNLEQRIEKRVKERTQTVIEDERHDAMLDVLTEVFKDGTLTQLADAIQDGAISDEIKGMMCSKVFGAAKTGGGKGGSKRVSLEPERVAVFNAMPEKGEEGQSKKEIMARIPAQHQERLSKTATWNGVTGSLVERGLIKNTNPGDPAHGIWVRTKDEYGEKPARGKKKGKAHADG